MIRANPIVRMVERARVVLLMLVLVPVLAFFGSRHTIAQEPVGRIGAGERVVLRFSGAAHGKDSGEPIRSRRENHIYLVQAADGPSVTLKAEDDCVIVVTASSKWAIKAAEVAPPRDKAAYDRCVESYRSQAAGRKKSGVPTIEYGGFAPGVEL